MGNVRTVGAWVMTAVLLAGVGGIVLVGRGQASPSLHLGSGAAWFPTLRQGSVALIDGATGGRVTRVDRAAKPNGNFEVEQSGSSALVVDRDAGTVTKVDAATWQLGTPVPVGSPGDDRLAVHAGGRAAWVVSQSGTIVQQLDPASMTLIGLPQTLPSTISGLAVDGDGRLWVTSQSGELRSYRNGEQVTSVRVAGGGATALVLVNHKPVVVDLDRGGAQLVDAEQGTPDRALCLDVPTSPPPVVGGSGGDAPWLLAVGPTAGTLVVSDVGGSSCQAITLGPTATTPRYGTPVEKDRFVFVPDFLTGQVIAVDPQAAPGQQIRARIDLGLPNVQVALLVHNEHVWFNDPVGDQAGVITDDFHALATSKADAGSSAGQAPAPTPTPDPAPPADTGDPNGAAAADPAGPVNADPAAGPAAPSSAAQPGIGPPGPELPSPADNGNRGGSGAKAGGAGGAGGGAGGAPPTTAPAPVTTAPAVVAAQFTISPTAAITGQPVTFTDATIGDHTVVSWAAPDGQPKGGAGASFNSTFGAPGTHDVTLTINTAAGAKSVTRQVSVNTLPKVPNLQGLTAAEAKVALEAVGLVIGTKTATVASVIPAGLIVDSQPKAGATAAEGTPVNFRDSVGVGIITTVAGPAAPAALNHPARLASDRVGNIYIADYLNNQVKKLARNGTVTVIAGKGGAYGFSGDGGPATLAEFAGALAVALNAAGDIFIADQSNERVRKVDHLTGIITTVAGTGNVPAGPVGPGMALATDLGAQDIDITSDGSLWITSRGQRQVLQVKTDGTLTPVPTPPLPGIQLTDPASIEFDANNVLYVAEPHAHQILRYDVDHYTRIAGLGPNVNPGYDGDGKLGPDTLLNNPDTIRFDGFGNLYFPDEGNARVRMLSAADGKVYTVAGTGVAGNNGNGGPADQAQINNADGCCSAGLVFDSDGSLVFSDLANDRLRKVWVAPPAPTDLATPP